MSPVAGDYGELVQEMGWAHLTVHALRWQLPAESSDQAGLRCMLTGYLLSRCPQLAPTLLGEYLIPGFVSSSTDPLEAAPMTASSETNGKKAILSQTQAQQQGTADRAAVARQPACPWDLARKLLASLRGGLASLVSDEAERRAMLTAAATYATWLLQLEAEADPLFAGLAAEDLDGSGSALDSDGDVVEDLGSSAARALDMGLAAVDAVLAGWGAAPLGASGGREVAALEALFRTLAGEVDRLAAARAAGRGDASDVANCRFQARCHLKARLLMCGVSTASGMLTSGSNVGDNHPGEHDAGATDTDTDSIVGNAKAATTIWKALRREPFPIQTLR